MKKRIISLIAALALLLGVFGTLSAVMAAGGVSPTLTPSSAAVSRGSQVKVTLSLTTGESGIASLLTRLSWPADILQFESCSAADAANTVLPGEASGGTYDVLYRPNRDTTFAGETLYTVTFKAIAEGSATVSVGLKDDLAVNCVNASYATVPFSKSSTRITVGRPTYSFTFSSPLSAPYGTTYAQLAQKLNESTTLWADAEGSRPEGNWSWSGTALRPGAGSSAAVFTFTPAEGSGYAVSQGEVQLAISPLELEAQAAVTPNEKVYDGFTTLPEGAAFTVTLPGVLEGDEVTADTSAASGVYDSAEPGSRTILVSGVTLTGSGSANYTLRYAQLSAPGSIQAPPVIPELTLIAAARTFNGSPQPLTDEELILTVDETVLLAGTDYSVQYYLDGTAGQPVGAADHDVVYDFVVNGLGEFAGQVLGNGSLLIAAQPIPTSQSSLANVELTYGQPFEAMDLTTVQLQGPNGVPTGTAAPCFLVGETWAAEAPTAAGTYTIGLWYTPASGETAYRAGLVEGISSTLTILPKALAEGDVTLDADTVGYIAQPVHPAPVSSLLENTDFTVLWPEATTEPGSYSCTVTGKGNYTGTLTLPYSIVVNDLSYVSFTLENDTLTYNGAAQLPRVLSPLTENTDYEVSIAAPAVNVGSYTLTVTGKGIAEGTVKTLDFSIAPKALTPEDARLSADSFSYNGAPQVPTLETALAETTDYTVLWPEGCTEPGTYAAVLTGLGNYTGTLELKWAVVSGPWSAEVKAAARYSLYPSNLYVGRRLGDVTFADIADGTLAWKDPEALLALGSNACEAVFTPANSGYLPVTVPVTVHVGEFAPDYRNNVALIMGSSYILTPETAVPLLWPEGCDFQFVSTNEAIVTVTSDSAARSITLTPAAPGFAYIRQMLNGETAALIPVKVSQQNASCLEASTAQVQSIADTVKALVNDPGSMTAMTGAQRKALLNELRGMILGNSLSAAQQQALKASSLSDPTILSALDTLAAGVTVETDCSDAQKASALTASMGAQAAAGSDSGTIKYILSDTAAADAFAAWKLTALLNGSEVELATPVTLTVRVEAPAAGSWKLMLNGQEQAFDLQAGENGTLLTFSAPCTGVYALYNTAPTPTPAPESTPEPTSEERAWLHLYACMLNAAPGSALQADMTACSFLPGYIIGGVEKLGVSLYLTTPAGELRMMPETVSALNSSYNYTFENAIAILGSVKPAVSRPAATPTPAATAAPIKDPTGSQSAPAPTAEPTPMPTLAPDASGDSGSAAFPVVPLAGAGGAITLAGIAAWLLRRKS